MELFFKLILLHALVSMVKTTLHDDVFANYSKHEVPRNKNKTGDFVPVSIFLGATIRELSLEDDMTMKTSALVFMWWKDDRLHWDPYAYEYSPKDIRAPANTIWSPQLFAFFGANVEEAIIDPSKSPILVDLYSDGFISWLSILTIHGICLHASGTEIGSEKETRNCTIMITPMHYTKDKVKFAKDPLIVIDEATDTGAWSIVSTDTKLVDETYTGFDDVITYQTIEFYVIVEKRNAILLYEAPVQLIIAQLFALASLWLPISSKQKITLVCFSCLITIVSDWFTILEIPEELHNTVPMLVKYHTFTIVMLLLILTVEIIAMRMFYHEPSGYANTSVPYVLRATLFHPLIRKLTCLLITPPGQQKGDKQILSENAEKIDGQTELDTNKPTVEILETEWRILGVILERCTFAICTAIFVTTWIILALEVAN